MNDGFQNGGPFGNNGGPEPAEEETRDQRGNKQACDTNALKAKSFRKHDELSSNEQQFIYLLTRWHNG